jgi:iron complex outermembrane receptor protein
VGLQQYRKRIWDVAQRVRHHRRLDGLYRSCAQHAHEEGIYSAPKLVDKSGKATVSRLDTNRISDSVSGMAGVRGNFTTGFVSHKVNVGYSAMTKNEKIAWKMSAAKDNPTTNIYHNTGVDMPDSTNLNGSGGSTAIR